MALRIETESGSVIIMRDGKMTRISSAPIIDQHDRPVVSMITSARVKVLVPAKVGQSFVCQLRSACGAIPAGEVVRTSPVTLVEQVDIASEELI